MPFKSKHSLDGGGRVYCDCRKGQQVGAWRMAFSRSAGNFRIDVNKTTGHNEVAKAQGFANDYARLVEKTVHKQFMGIPLNNEERQIAGLKSEATAEVYVGTLGEQIEPFLLTRESPPDSPYIRNCRDELRIVFQQLALGLPKSQKLNMMSLTAMSIRAALLKLKETKKWHARSYNRHRSAMYKFCEYLKPAGLNPNPVELIPTLSESDDPVRPARAFSDEELVSLIQTCVEDTSVDRANKADSIGGMGDAAMIFIAVYTGLRAGHIRNLVKENITILEDGVIVEPNVTVQRHKSKKGIVNAITDPWAVEIISKYLMKLPAGVKLFPVARAYTSRLITLRSAEAREKWIEKAKTAKLKGERMASSFLAKKDTQGFCLTFHALRNTTATRALDAGISSIRVQKMMGHSKAAMTAHYDRPAHAALLKQAALIPSLPRPQLKLA